MLCLCVFSCVCLVWQGVWVAAGGQYILHHGHPPCVELPSGDRTEVRWSCVLLCFAACILVCITLGAPLPRPEHVLPWVHWLFCGLQEGAVSLWPKAQRIPRSARLGRHPVVYGPRDFVHYRLHPICVPGCHPPPPLLCVQHLGRGPVLYHSSGTIRAYLVTNTAAEAEFWS